MGALPTKPERGIRLPIGGGTGRTPRGGKDDDEAAWPAPCARARVEAGTLFALGVGGLVV